MSFSFTFPEQTWRLHESENLTVLSYIYGDRDIVYSLIILTWFSSQVTQRTVQAQLPEVFWQAVGLSYLKISYIFVFTKTLAVERSFLADLLWLISPGNIFQALSTRFSSTSVQLPPSPSDASPRMDASWNNSCPPLSKVQEICFIALGYVMDLTEML